MTENCIFCKIISGELESSIVARDDHAIAIMDIAPINEGHVLIIPQTHAVELGDLSEDEASSVFRLVHRVAVALPVSGVRCEGYGLTQANGTAAGQEVFHVHFHLIPRFAGDSLRISLNPHRPKFSRAELNRCAQQIAEAMK